MRCFPAVGKRAPWGERVAVSFEGIRGIGCLYLSYALIQEEFVGAEELWALVGLVLLVSIVVHGVTAAPVTVHDWREQENHDSAAA